MGFNLHGKVSLDGSGFSAGLRSLGRESKMFAGEMKSLAMQAFGVITIQQAISKTVHSAETLVNTAKRIGDSVEGLQVLKAAAKDGGTELDNVAAALERINDARSRALGGDAGALSAFGKVGISQSDLLSKSASELFKGQLSSAAKIMSPETLGPAFKEIMGKGFGQLLPVLQTDFDALSDELQRTGRIMKTETAVSLKAMGDQLETLQGIIIVGIAPALVSFAELLVKIFAGLSATWEYFRSRFTNGTTIANQSRIASATPGFATETCAPPTWVQSR